MVKLKAGYELIVVNLLMIILVIITRFSSPDTFRWLLSLLFLFFFPGYAFTLILFPRKDPLTTLERIGLSFGCSIAITPLIGLIMNFCPWGLSLESTVYAQSIVIFILSCIAWYRLLRIPSEERHTAAIRYKLLTSGRFTIDKVLSAVVAVLICGVIGILFVTISSPGTGEKYTEFSILGSNGEMNDYPESVAPGEQLSFELVTVNHETVPEAYRIQILIEEKLIDETGIMSLEDGEEWNQPVRFSIDSVGENQKLDFLLFKEGVDQPYRTLHLWVDVITEKQS